MRQKSWLNCVLRLVLLAGLTIFALLLFLQNRMALIPLPNRLVAERQMKFEYLEEVILPEPTTTAAPTLSARLKKILGCHSRQLAFEKLQYGSYWLLKNYIRGTVSRNVGCAEIITYTTNGDYTFLDNLPMIVTYWMAPVSFALYAPGYDFEKTMDSIQYFRNCLPESELIRQLVTFHIFFPTTHMPKNVPLTEQDAVAWNYNCTLESVNKEQMYRAVHNLTYPINVARNIARKAVNTYFIFACDAELYPSKGLAEQFLEMVVNNVSVLGGVDNKPRVFPLPVFELEANATIPANKAALVAMLQNKTAIPFHAHICRNCHKVPRQDEWIAATDDKQLSVFSVGKRLNQFKYWEPFYISDNTEPYFDERVTWEGQSNKRIQNFAMCLMDFEYHVLHPGFLVHRPGIKRYSKRSYGEAVQEMNRLISRTIDPEYRILYGKNKNCTT